jgi:DNA gyrase subunit A
MAMTAARTQGRGGKGVTAGDTKEGDFMEHIFVASTHAYILFFTDRGRVHWLKVYDLPLQGRTSRGRSIVNMIKLQEGEKVTNLIPVREFDATSALMMATRRGLVKKTALEAYSRPMKGGIIAIKLEENDSLIGVALTRPGDEVVLSTKKGKCIRFNESDARAMGRATYGVKGITLREDDEVVGMAVADPDPGATLLTVCELGFGKRTPFGTSGAPDEGEEEESASEARPAESAAAETPTAPAEQGAAGAAEPGGPAEEQPEPEATTRGNMRYRTQRRGGKGLIDIKTSARNGDVVAITSVHDDDQVMITTTRGMLVRIRVSDIRVIGRNTQGVRLIRLEEGDTVAGMAKIAAEKEED